MNPYAGQPSHVYIVTSYFKPFVWLNGYSRNGVEYLCSNDDVVRLTHFVIAPHTNVAKSRARELVREDVKELYGADANAHIYLQRCKLSDT